MTSSASTTLPRKMYDDARTGKFQKVLEYLVEDMRSLFYDGITSRDGTTYFFAVIHVMGDWPLTSRELVKTLQRLLLQRILRVRRDLAETPAERARFGSEGFQRHGHGLWGLDLWVYGLGLWVSVEGLGVTSLARGFRF